MSTQEEGRERDWEGRLSVCPAVMFRDMFRPDVPESLSYSSGDLSFVSPVW